MGIGIRCECWMSFSGRRPRRHTKCTSTKLTKLIRMTVKRQLKESFDKQEAWLAHSLRRAVREEIHESLEELFPAFQNEVRSIVRDTINATVPGIVRSVLDDVLYSPAFADYLRSLFPPNANFGQVAAPFLNQSVILTTTGGTVTGVLAEIGNDYVRIVETANSEVLIPFSSAISIIAQ